MKREEIKELALARGFKLKPQPDGSEDLNPYVYEFAQALITPLQADMERLQQQNRDLIDASEQQCGCGYDDPADICLGHKAKLDSLEQERDQLKAVLHGAVDELVERISAATQSIQCEDGAGSFVSAGAVNNAVSHLRKSINDPVNHLAAHDAEVIEQFCAWLKANSHLDKTTHDGAIEYINQRRQQAQEVQS
ncbi:hypothetical protein [Marinobacterium stanieri]|uniref:hypothetical protein n=1 Tax=Marinobacterium stanieri TaxID=49186 RepID=UPI003A8D30EA